MFTTPLVGSVQAWGWRCNRGCPQDYMVTVAPAWGGYELLDYKFIPSETDPCMAIFKWKEALRPVGNDITVGDNTYSLGTHFEYSGKMVVLVYEPFPPFSAPARPFLAWGERVIWMFWYQYDFSAVSGGLDGKINMFAYVCVTRWICR